MVDRDVSASDNPDVFGVGKLLQTAACQPVAGTATITVGDLMFLALHGWVLRWTGSCWPAQRNGRNDGSRSDGADGVSVP